MMKNKPFISILIAEDNDISRQLLKSIVETHGYRTFEAIDGQSAADVVDEHEIDLALVDVNMSPAGGLEFAKHIMAEGLKIPIVLVTADESADLLTYANSLNVAMLMQKPVDPARLIKTIQHILKRNGINPEPMGVEGHETSFKPEEIMEKVIEMASANVRDNKGGPYAAIVTDQGGKILGRGTNRHAARYDPVAHAEVMAIRQVAEKLGRSDLSDCIVYCSSYPTKIGAALIESVGVRSVYYGVSPEDTGIALKPTEQAEFKQLCKDQALTLFNKD